VSAASITSPSGALIGAGYPGGAAARNTGSATAFYHRTNRTNAIDCTERGLRIRDERRNYDDAIDHDDVIHPVGDHSHVHCRQYDRNHIASVPGRQFIDHCLQLYAGRPADQRRGFAALDTGNFDESPPRHDLAGYNAACRHQPRSDDDRGADTKYVGLRREHDDEPGHARHDGAGQCHRCHDNPRRIASAGLLMRGCHGTNSPAKSQMLLGGIAMK
jgi:hypothetical protein